MKFDINKKQGIEIKLVLAGQECCNFRKMLKENKIFEAKLGQTYYKQFEDGTFKILLGLGDENELTIKKLRNTFYQFGKEIAKLDAEEFFIQVDKYNNLCSYKTAFAIVEGFMYSEYEFDFYRSNKCNKKQRVIHYNVNPEKAEKVLAAIKEAEVITDSVFLTRNLVNMRANTIYPETLAEIAIKELESVGAKVSVYSLKEIEELQMHAFLNVARASKKEPKLIVMEYKNNPDSQESIALVGKGVTYDSGGLAIKPATGMVDMFCDMAGAATVIGTMKALAQNKAKTNVFAVVAACENMIDGDAYKNGDVIQSMSGKTIEIVNTDAEGRLTLADAVYFATAKLSANKVIDIATLTGSCVAALGERVSGVVSNNTEFYQQLKIASKKADEHIHRFPAIDYYKDMNKSDVADIKNSGGRQAGVITAGLFVGSFLAKDVPWIHIDIAGTAYVNTAYDCITKGASGTMLKTLYYLCAE